MNQITECLHSPNHGRNAAVAARRRVALWRSRVYLQFKNIADRIVGCTAQLAEEFSVIPEVNS